MASGFTPQVDREELRAQMCNLLRLLEQSGMRELVLAAPRPAASGARTHPGAARSTARSAGQPTPGAERKGDGGGGGGAVMEDLCRTVSGCTLCELHGGRTKAVCGEGNLRARLVFIGEGPGADEDAQGRPFVGRAGQLLNKVIEAMGLERADVYITNVVKCRPPGNRTPEPDEIASCLPYLERQMELIGPEVICTLGNVATQSVTGERRPISEMRGRTYVYRDIKLIPTFHPAACLRNPDCKKLVWEDIKKVMKILDLPIRGVKRDGPSKNGN
jgi:uracil-DNA glycosylase family 4